MSPDTPNDDTPEALALATFVELTTFEKLKAYVLRLRADRYHRGVVEYSTWVAGERVRVRVEVFRRSKDR